jgi:hypothetical protein
MQLALFLCGVATATVPSFPAAAKGPKISPQEAEQQILYELKNPNGGIAYMQRQIDEGNFEALMEFTKTYDQSLRKTYLGKGLKPVIADGNRATELANAVTFDLIGINRNTRPGQTNAVGANQYLQELRDDIQAFLALPRTE